MPRLLIVCALCDRVLSAGDPLLKVTVVCMLCQRRQLDRLDRWGERRHADRRSEQPGLGGVPGLDRRLTDRRRDADR